MASVTAGRGTGISTPPSTTLRAPHSRLCFRSMGDKLTASLSDDQPVCPETSRIDIISNRRIRGCLLCPLLGGRAQNQPRPGASATKRQGPGHDVRSGLPHENRFRRFFERYRICGASQATPVAASKRPPRKRWAGARSLNDQEYLSVRCGCSVLQHHLLRPLLFHLGFSSRHLGP